MDRLETAWNTANRYAEQAEEARELSWETLEELDYLEAQEDAYWCEVAHLREISERRGEL